jgi:alpha-L-arabinofuranosidase
MGNIDEDVYGHFLEHINHSVEDGLFAEQVQGQGFEGNDFATYWKPLAENGSATIVDVTFANGEKSLRLAPRGGVAGVSQGRIYLQQGKAYNGSAWLKPEQGSPEVRLVWKDTSGNSLAEAPLGTSGSAWQEVKFSFTSPKTDRNAQLEVVAQGNGAVLIDCVSMMLADVRANGMLRTDLLDSLRALKPPFLRWPGGSFASIYKWKDGIGPHFERKFHPNTIWGGYSDYYGFGTEEYMRLCRELKSEPMVVFAATSTDRQQFQDAMDWVHYLNDPPTTEWGRKRAANGHPEPYRVRYFQIDNEPMNHGLTPEKYAEIVNLYGPELRKIAPEARIVACGQKRSNDMIWSQKMITLAGDNFDILGCHNYEYEPENFQAGVQRIGDYLVKLRDYIRLSKHPNIKIGVLEWNSSRTYDWRAGLHAAGNLILYEKLGPEVEMSCPALLMRNTSDDPTWTSFIYHDHVSWFPGAAYVVQKVFREHYAEKHLASTAGTFRDLPDRKVFFDDISQMKPEDWTPGTVDAIATASGDGRRIVIKAVNYDAKPNLLWTRLQGSKAPTAADVRIHTIRAEIQAKASLENPDLIHPTERTMPFQRDLAIELPAHSVVVVEISTR